LSACGTLILFYDFKFLDFLYKINVQYLSLCVWLISLSIICSFTLLQMTEFPSFFNGWISFLFLSLYPFIYWRTLRLILFLGCHE
jgi:hypothetical protein